MFLGGLLNLTHDNMPKMHPAHPFSLSFPVAATDDVWLEVTTDLLQLGHPNGPGPLQVPPLGSMDTGYSSPLAPSHAEPPALPPSKPHTIFSSGPGVKAGRGFPSPLLGWASFHFPLLPVTPEQEEGEQHEVPVNPCMVAG